ncbi:MAG: PTS glucose transporter subunit IIA [Clostridia bacterium]|nr:PTS glucose transporter subunit IIA [Clostridia bacterium]
MFWKKKKVGSIFSICDGQIIRLSEVSDPVFSEKILGDGVAIFPESQEILSPVDGKIIQVFDTKHAYSILSDDGLEILVHIGLNTVELKGEGFKSFVNNGDMVKIGQKIAEINIEYIESMGYQLYTPVLITNLDKIDKIDAKEGKIKKGEEIIRYIKK